MDNGNNSGEKKVISKVPAGFSKIYKDANGNPAPLSYLDPEVELTDQELADEILLAFTRGK